MLQHIDNPLVLKFLMEQAAENVQQLKGTNKFSPWLLTLKTDLNLINGTRCKRLSPDSVQAIRECWDSDKAESQLSETAFKFWVRAIDDLKVLQTIPVDHPHFDTVLWQRAILGDFSTIPLIIERVTSNDKWFHVIDKVWTQKFVDVTDNAIQYLKKHTPIDYTGGQTDGFYVLAELLRDIPAKDAQLLLIKNWNHLRYSPLFVQAVLYIGSAECIELATEAINHYPSEVNPFEHIDSFFGFSIKNRSDRLEFRHLEVLLPYLGRLSSITLSSMVDFCWRRGNYSWSHIYLKPEFNRRRTDLPKVKQCNRTHLERMARHYFPSDSDLLEDLDCIEQHNGHIHYWSEEFAKRQDSHLRWRNILNEWFSQNPTIGRFQIFTDAISKNGNRGDIDLLYKFTIQGDSETIKRLQANARFSILRRTVAQ